MVEPIYKDLVIETETEMEKESQWLLFCGQVHRAKSLKYKGLACIQTGQCQASCLRRF